jgi:hypothetical protein
VQRLQWFCIFLAVSPALRAEADGPDFWQVRDVARDDVLNVRQYADFRAQKIGEIPPDAQCIKNRGCRGGLSYHEFTTLSEAEKARVLKLHPRWCRVSYQGQTGWVAGRYLQEASCVASAADLKVPGTLAVDPYNHRYLIEGETVSLHHGSAHIPIEGSAASMVTEVAGQPVFANLNGDGRKDAVVILQQQSGGSGTFYYLAAALADAAATSGTDVSSAPVIGSYFLGDRIKVEKVSVVDNAIVVDSLDRVKGQPMSGQAAVWSIKSFKLIGDQLTVLP